MNFNYLPKFKQNIGLMMTSPTGIVLWAILYLVSTFIAVFLVRAIIITALGWPYAVYLIGCTVSGLVLGMSVVIPPWRWRAAAKTHLENKNALDNLETEK